MTTTDQVTQHDTGTDADAPTRRRRGGAVLVGSVLAAALPFLVGAVRVLVHRGDLQFAGDQALIGLAVGEASHAAQLLGPYSRYGWAHPGPAWFYALVPGWEALGRTDAALVAASLAVHAVLAAGVVLTVHRRSSVLRAPVTALVLVVLVIRLPASVFVDVWNPFALLMATVLLLALAGRAARGHWSTLLWVAVVGSYLVQTHVGALPLVGLVGLVALGAIVVARRGGNQEPRGRRTAVTSTAGALAVLVAMWVAPVVQQLTAGPGEGNLGRLLDFFTGGGSEGTAPTWGQSVTAVGRVLGLAPYGWATGPLEMDLGYRPVTLMAGVALQALAVLLLLAVARRVRSAEAGWSAAAVGAALVAALVSVHTVTGPVYWYLIIWVAVLPASTLVAAVVVVDAWIGRPFPARAVGPALRRAVAAGTAALLVGAVAGASWSVANAVEGLPDSPGVHRALTELEGRLPSSGEGRVVHLEIVTHELWPVATGVAEELATDGWEIQVSPGSADLFGSGRVGDPAAAAAVVVVVAAGQAPPDLGVRLKQAGTISSELGPVDLLVGDAG